MTNTSSKPKILRHAGRQKFKQTIDSALSAFIRTPAGAGLNYDAFDPRTPDLQIQSAIVTLFAQFLKETDHG